MAGLRRICKMYGEMVIQGQRWVWDFARDEPVLASEMAAEQLRDSERVRWNAVREKIQAERPEAKQK